MLYLTNYPKLMPTKDHEFPAAYSDRGARFAPTVYSTQDNVIGTIDPRIKPLKCLCINLKARSKVMIVPDNYLEGIPLGFLVVVDFED